MRDAKKNERKKKFFQMNHEAESHVLRALIKPFSLLCWGRSQRKEKKNHMPRTRERKSEKKHGEKTDWLNRTLVVAAFIKRANLYPGIPSTAIFFIHSRSHSKWLHKIYFFLPQRKNIAFWILLYYKQFIIIFAFSAKSWWYSWKSQFSFFLWFVPRLRLIKKKKFIRWEKREMAINFQIMHDFNRNGY